MRKAGKRELKRMKGIEGKKENKELERMKGIEGKKEAKSWREKTT